MRWGAEPPAVAHPPVRAMLLITAVRGMRERELLIKTPLDLRDALLAVSAGSRWLPDCALPPTPVGPLEATPAVPTAGDKPVGIKLKLDAGDDLFARRLLGFALGLQARFGRLQCRPASVPGAQRLGQLVPARIA